MSTNTLPGSVPQSHWPTRSCTGPTRTATAILRSCSRVAHGIPWNRCGWRVWTCLLLNLSPRLWRHSQDCSTSSNHWLCKDVAGNARSIATSKQWSAPLVLCLGRSDLPTDPSRHTGLQELSLTYFIFFSCKVFSHSHIRQHISLTGSVQPVCDLLNKLEKSFPCRVGKHEKL